MTYFLLCQISDTPVHIGKGVNCQSLQEAAPSIHEPLLLCQALGLCAI